MSNSIQTLKSGIDAANNPAGVLFYKRIDDIVALLTGCGVYRCDRTFNPD